MRMCIGGVPGCISRNSPDCWDRFDFGEYEDVEPKVGSVITE
jgi:hypothetical protein